MTFKSNFPTGLNIGTLALNTDSYKVSMNEQYPSNTKKVYSYVESRGGRYDETMFFGLQSFVKEYLLQPVTKEEVEFADFLWTTHGEPFPRAGWDRILNKHGGYIPVTIKAVKEGRVVPTKNVLTSVINNDDELRWNTTWIETGMLRAIWYGTTVATNSLMIRRIIKGYLEKSGDIAGLNFKLHDFGARGASSFETAGLGGLAHLATGAQGTDTMTANLFAMKYYGATKDNLPGYSIAASEHSTITSWGRKGEADAYMNMIAKFGKPGAIFACVSDSYDIYRACEMWGSMAERVRLSGATLVVRPDSGDPVEVLPRIARILEAKFGFTINAKGYKVLNDVRLIWGDGINELSIQSILRVLVDLHGYSADNIAFGMGGALLQDVTRDDQKFAMKASAALINDEWVDVFKDPITDPGKASKKGLVTLWNSGSEFETSVDQPQRWVDNGFEWTEALDLVYSNGELFRDQTIYEIRDLANA